jgi:hypothetical protein
MLRCIRSVSAGLITVFTMTAALPRVEAAVCSEGTLAPPCTVLLDNLRVRAWTTDGTVPEGPGRVGPPRRIVITLPKATGTEARELSATIIGKTIYVGSRAGRYDGRPGDGDGAVVIDIKAASLPHNIEMAAAYPRPGARLLADASGAAVWEQRLVPGTPGRMRSYARDTVIAWLSGGAVRVRRPYEAAEQRVLALPSLDFVSAGAARLEEALRGSSRAVIVELK